MEQRPRVLLIEDHDDTRELYTLALEAAKLDVLAVRAVSDGTAIVQERAFELVITDLVMGTYDADATWTGFRGLLAAARPTPVGIVSGLTVAEAGAAAEGAAFFLRKPFRLSALFAELAPIFGAPLPAGARETAAAYLHALERGAWDELVALCTDDVVYRFPGNHPGLSTTVRGRAAFRQLSEETFRAFREPAFTIEHVHPLPDVVVVDYVGSWLDGDERRSAPGTIFLQLRDGLIAEINVRADVLALTAGDA